MKFTRLFPAAATFLLCLPLGAQTLKVGSLVPARSPWDTALRSISAEWTRLSAGALTVKIYGSGAAGDEPDLLRKIRIGQLDMAMISMSGLQSVYNGVKALSFPLLLTDDGELSYVLDGMKPRFEMEIEARGFKVIAWSPGGWLYFFSRRPIVTPDDLRAQRLWVWGNPDEMQAWQSSGFQVVPLAATEILTSLQSGMIDAVISSPLLAAANQWFGAMIISERSWEKIPKDLQPTLLRSAQKTIESLAPAILKSDSDAISKMKEYGLQVVEVDSRARAHWEKDVSGGFALLLGKAYDAEAFQAAKGFLEEYRASLPGRPMAYPP
jgi:TRAP-type C4-dicarboxylate transport system substrate-binding protein